VHVHNHGASALWDGTNQGLVQVLGKGLVKTAAAAVRSIGGDAPIVAAV
jgi:hypothetical protein